MTELVHVDFLDSTDLGSKVLDYQHTTSPFWLVVSSPGFTIYGLVDSGLTLL